MSFLDRFFGPSYKRELEEARALVAKINALEPDVAALSDEALGEKTALFKERLAKGEWGTYAGGPAPGLAFETCAWIFEKEIATICSDTWGIEVRPNETDELGQPLHWVTIHAIGVTHGEMFFVKDLAADCAADRVYEFFFAAPPLVPET